MNVQVMYFSRKGNTKKIADAIATELGVSAENVKNATLQKDSLIFLGSGCYGGKPGNDMISFIESNTFKSREVALFGTSGGGEGKEVEEMTAMLKQKNATIKGSFFCKGQFMLFSRGKPSERDLIEAKQFAKNMYK